MLYEVITGYGNVRIISKDKTHMIHCPERALGTIHRHHNLAGIHLAVHDPQWNNAGMIHKFGRKAAHKHFLKPGQSAPPHDNGIILFFLCKFDNILV